MSFRVGDEVYITDTTPLSWELSQNYELQLSILFQRKTSIINKTKDMDFEPLYYLFNPNCAVVAKRMSFEKNLEIYKNFDKYVEQIQDISLRTALKTIKRLAHPDYETM